jgi:hypothetical protein
MSSGASHSEAELALKFITALQQGDFSALLDVDADKDPLVGAILEQSNLSPQQAMIFKLLANSPAVRDGVVTDGVEVGDGEGVRDVVDEPTGSPSAKTEGRLRALQQELADLREVNDTLAAALGACHVCWGGDSDCHECAGRGTPGSRRPDPRLFSRLVLPAVRRVRQICAGQSPNVPRRQRTQAERTNHGI